MHRPLLLLLLLQAIDRRLRLVTSPVGLSVR